MAKRKKRLWYEPRPKSAWSDSAIIAALRQWCELQDIRGHYRLPRNKSLFSLFIARSDSCYAQIGRGDVLYHVSQTREYELSVPKLEAFFDKSNLIRPGETGPVLTVNMPDCHWSERGYQNEAAKPYDPAAPPNMSIYKRNKRK